MGDTFPQIERSSRGLMQPPVALAAVIGIGIVIESLRRSRPRRQSALRGTRAALSTYLREHLSGSDAATQLVERLRKTHAGTEDGRLFGTLFEEFQHEREVVEAVLASLGASGRSAKRLAANASASVLKLTAGGEPGALSLFRTLEGLSIGVQGKRCLWRALRGLDLAAPAPGSSRFAELESLAVRQWEALERRRLSLVSATFAAEPRMTPRRERAC